MQKKHTFFFGIKKTLKHFFILTISTFSTISAYPTEKTLLQENLSTEGLDTKIVTGQLENGVCYYIRENSFPARKAFVQLTVKAGSIYEQESEKGWSHLVEHLVFRGSRDFPNNAAEDYLKSIGVPQGADANAYTGFESTEYHFEIPLEDEALEKTLQILSNFSSFATFSEDIFEIEKGVVLDELHQRTSTAGWGITKNYFNTFLASTPYAHHFPIGVKEPVKNGKRDELYDFYKRWYTPDRFGVIVIGDIDAGHVQQLIEQHFGPLLCTETKAPPAPPVLSPAESRALIVVDPELTTTNVALEFFSPYLGGELVDKQKAKISFLACAIQTLLNHRLSSLPDLGGSPILNIGVESSDISPKLGRYAISASVFGQEIKEGLELIGKELGKSVQLGFSKQEWTRTRESLKKSWSESLLNRDRFYHQDFAETCNMHFLVSAPLVSREWALHYLLELADQVTLKEINSAWSHFYQRNPTMLLIATPDPSIQEAPEEELLEIFKSNRHTFSHPAEEITSPIATLKPLFAPGEIVQVEENPTTCVSTWTLSNGITLSLKESSLVKDEVMIEGKALGGFGSSRTEAERGTSLLTLDYVIHSGIDGLSYRELDDLAKNKRTSFNFSLSRGKRSVTLNSNQDNIETAFQILHAFFAAPKFDPEQWKNVTKRWQEHLKHESNDPQILFNRFVIKTNTSNHSSFQPLNLEHVSEDLAQEIFLRYFGSAAPFHFVIVGDFDKEKISSLVEKYLASLPRPEKTVELSNSVPSFPKGVIEEEFKKGKHSYVTTLITIPYDATQKSRLYARAASRKILQIRLKNLLRHALGNTYNVSVSDWIPFDPDDHFAITEISFTSQEEERQHMKEAILAAINDFKKSPPSPEELSNIRAFFINDEQKNAQFNEYWIDNILFSKTESIPLEKVLDYTTLINTMTAEDVLEATQVLFASPDYTVISHLPETN